MDWHQMERNFSAARIGRYKVARGGDRVLAVSDYSRNLHLAESMMPMLNVLEVGLRNALYERLACSYRREDGWVEWSGRSEFARLSRSVEEAKSKLTTRRERVIPDKVLAELTFGFWCTLFNASYQGELWKELRLAFPACPRDERKRRTVCGALNQVRALRNRVFHHEPLLWMKPNLSEQHGKGVMVVGWIDPALAAWLARHDRFPDLWPDGPRSCMDRSDGAW